MVNTEIRLYSLHLKMEKLYLVSKTRPGADCGSEHELQIEIEESRGNAAEGNGTPLQYSCLENPMNRRAW